MFSIRSSCVALALATFWDGFICLRENSVKLGMIGGVGSCISIALLFKKLNKQTLSPTTLNLQTHELSL